jgi:hypothetical protein
VPAPTIGTPLGSAYNTVTEPKTAGPFTLAAGDFLVVVAAFEDNRTPTTLVPTITTTGAAALTFTKAQEVTTTSHCRVIVYYSQTVVTPGSYTVSEGESSSNVLNYGIDAWPVTASGGVGVSNKADDPTTGAPTDAPSLTLSGVSANSAIFMVVGDWAATVVAGHAYLTTDAGAFTERTAQNTDGNYSSYSGVYADAGAAGTKVVGMSAPNQTWAIAALEILGTSGTTAPPNPLLRMLRQGGVQRALALMLLHPIPGPADLSAAITALSDIDTGTGTETGTVQATVPGSDTSTGTDTGTVSATFADTDAASGTDTQTTLSATVPGSDSATGTETSTGSITAPGSDSGTGTDAATTAVTLSGSDSGTGTDAQVSIVSPVAGSDTASGTEAGTVAVTVPGSESSTGTESSSASVTAAGTDSATGSDAGSAAASVPASDSATGTEGSVVTETGPGGEGGAGSDTGTVSATVPGSDSGSGTDAGSVADITGGATPISGSDSASGTESGTITVVASDTDSGAGTDVGTVVDLSAPPPDTGPTGGADYGDESAIHGEPTRHLTGSDRAGSMELGFVVDLTPKPVRPPLRIKLPRRPERPRVLDAADQARVVEDSALFVGVEMRSDMARGSESAQLVDITPEDPDEMAMVMALLFD